jgi:hypothetical protein
LSQLKTRTILIQSFEKKLESLVETLESDNSTDESFKLFFEELQENIEEHKPKFVDPLDDNPKDLLKYLIGINPVSKPDEAFKFSRASQTNAAIKEQLRKHQITLSSSIKEKDYRFVEFKLNEIKYLTELLDQNKSIKQIYQECLRSLVKTLNENYDHTKANFDSRLEIGNMLMEVNINEYKVAIETGKYIDSMKLNFKLYELQTSETLNLN